MKVLMLNGSCKKEGNTYNALLEIGKQLEKEGIDYEIFQTGSEPVRDCIGCGGCASGKCVYTDDSVNEFVEKQEQQMDLFWYPCILCTSKWTCIVIS